MDKPFSSTDNLKKNMKLILAFAWMSSNVFAQTTGPELQYIVSTPQPGTHYYHVELQASHWPGDTLIFRMPRWTPGYYQLMNYADAVEHFAGKDDVNRVLRVEKSINQWRVEGVKDRAFSVSYYIKAERQFVAQSYLDSARGYIVPASLFLYIDGYLDIPVQIKLDINKSWQVATGLTQVAGKQNEFRAPDFDTLYDCPILMGNLETLPPFRINGIEHRFIGYKLGTFDRVRFMKSLEQMTASAAAIIGDIPFDRYTFIGIGPGRGGIEHLNNTTVSFDGSGLNSPEAMNRMMNFLTHEYFHHYNVKRIRPLELGPFDYDSGSKTNLLWVSEGLTVYYEYVIMKRAGLIDEKTLYADFQNNIDATENNPGRFHQSLAQASYKTWSDGPFGNQGNDPQKSISYYDKGPVVGLLLDFAIRNATQNRKSLDDVMRLLYWKYYKKLNRGFTDAEFEQACETVSETSMTGFFEYVYTTRELDYNTYLGYAGLKINVVEVNQKRKFTLERLDIMNELQSATLKNWLGEP